MVNSTTENIPGGCGRYVTQILAHELEEFCHRLSELQSKIHALAQASLMWSYRRAMTNPRALLRSYSPVLPYAEEQPLVNK